MKKLGLLCLLATFVLAGCASNTTTSTMTADQLFAKKQECAKYKDVLQKEIDKEMNDVNSSDHIERIDEIFYSSTKNSCFALTTRVITNVGVNRNIINLLTNEETVYGTYLAGRAQQYDADVKKLKGE